MQHRPARSRTTWGMPSMLERCEVCGRTVMPSATDVVSQMNTLLAASLSEGLARLLSGMSGPSERATARPRRKWRDWADDCCDCDCGCERCAPDPCHCRCCVGDADLVIYARVGERRVVPLTITNSRRREREINLELSQWTTRSGNPSQIKAQILPPSKFTLKACEEQTVVIVVEAMIEAANAASTVERERLPDVDECEVFYADLRVEGCEIRPIRIALALLPRDCAAYEVDCGCSCC